MQAKKTGRFNMQKRKIKKMMLALMSVISIMTFAFNCYADNSLSWYTKRERDNLRPRLDKGLSIIESYNVYWIDPRYGDDCNEKVLYLTFDFGYENGNTERILNTLREKDVEASFFVLAHPINKETKLIKRMFEEGHAVCNHTMSHKNMAHCSDKSEFCRELTGLEELCKLKTGYDLDRYYRPPEGSFSESNLKFADEMGYKTVFWSFAYADWDNNNQPSAEDAIKLITDNTHNGAIILLHPTSKTNADILGRLIDIWREMGYEFRTVKELA